MARPVALLALVTVVLLGTACSHSASEPRLDGKKSTAVDDEPAPLIVSTSAAGISVAYPRGWQATGEPGDLSTDWKALRRPLHLPTVASGEACPRTPTERDAPNVAFTIGNGPVFPVLGFSEPAPGGIARLRDDIHRHGYYLHKTLWAISARYHGPALIRGRRIDGPGALRFPPVRRHVGGTAASQAELRVPAGPGKPDRPGLGWRYGPTVTLIPRAGCYAFQIDGRGFSRVLVFEARR